MLFNQENRLKSGQHHPKIWSTYRQQGGIFRLFLRTHFFAWSTCHKNLVNKLGFLVNLFCLRNPQNMSKKNRGKSLFSKLLPRISLIISIQSFILQLQPARLLTSIDYQQHISGLGNIWETFRACTAHSASMCQSINFYSLLSSFLFFRFNTYRFTCILALSANFACKINE